MTTPLNKTLIFSVFLVFTNVSNASLTITGPLLTTNLTGFNDTGLEFTAKKDITLDGFIFQNQGNQDTLKLIDQSTGNILQSYSYAGNFVNNQPVDNSLEVINLAWELNTGTTYILLSEEQSNGKWSNYSAFPTMNDHIQINNSHSDKLAGDRFWLNFNNLTTTILPTSVPIPATIWLFATGVLTLFGFKDHRKLKNV